MCKSYQLCLALSFKLIFTFNLCTPRRKVSRKYNEDYFSKEKGSQTRYLAWVPFYVDGRTEYPDKQNDTLGDERRDDAPCPTSESGIGSTDQESDGGESSQSNRPLPSSSDLESDEEDYHLSEELLAYKAFLDKLYPSCITGPFRT
ncbi:hypothetical protein AVEN_9067-1 [Araneus ventricosus]|uniref:Uncharacterized protein n=1 Tax=Araneus ventricosus TaxID=182803 RepID=A0A4Y2TBP6_ARAVE|nr:hypothetical protein AVEN_9067-1 [Araneus ventricosus]